MSADGGASSQMPAPAVTVVIATHERGEDCRQAVTSVLAQDSPPLEILVCDDGSGPATEALLRDLADQDPRLRYLRVDPSAGTPALARNLGIEHARGEWVAFLDDDDRWLPTKLSAQARFMETSSYDVVASDAVRTGGGRYFGARAGPYAPSRRAIVRMNPIIMSTAVVRRATLQQVGGFGTDRSLAAIADYDLWLRIADQGARFVITNEVLAIYEDTAQARLSTARIATQIRLARLKWRRACASPRDRSALRSAVVESARSLVLLIRSRS